ncbi:hypothetical protein D3C80_2208440 [compost metagenome]
MFLRSSSEEAPERPGRLKRRLGSAIGNQFDRRNQSCATNFANQWVITETL